MNAYKAIMIFSSIFRRLPMPIRHNRFADWLLSMMALFMSFYELGKELNMTTIDISQMNVPNEYLPMMLLIVIPVVTFFGYLISMQSYNDVLKTKSMTKDEMPYDNKYLAASIASIVLGIALGISLVPIALDYMGIIGAGSILYGAIGAILGTIIMWVLTRVSHCGIDVLITDVQKINSLASTATDTAKDAISNLDTSITGLENAINKKE